MAPRTGLPRAICLTAGLALGGGAAAGPAAAPAPPAPSPRFADVTHASGLPVRGQTSGAVLVDLDGDGLRDLLLGRHGRVPEAYRNLGRCRFARLPGWGAGIDIFDHHATLVDDLDGDGAADLYFVVGAHRGEGIGNNALHPGPRGDTADLAPAWGVQDPFGRGRGALLVDVAGDGGRDLLVLNYRTAPRAYALRPPGPMRDRAGALFGLPPAGDAAVAEVAGRGEPSGAARRRGEYVHDLWPQDLDDDGRADYLALGVPPVRILRGADGVARPDLPALPPEACVPSPVAGAWGDFDGDGRPDLYLVYGEDDAPSHFAAPRRNRLLLGRAGRFTDAADSAAALAGAGVACAAGDLDNDGAIDLVVLQTRRATQRSRTRILLNGGDGRCAEPPVASPVAADTPGLGDGVLAADLDADGDLDLLVLVGAIGPADPGGGVRVYRNDLASGHWLDVRPEPRGRRLPWGTRVAVVVAGGRRQARQCWPCQVHGSAFPAPLHFGLGRAARIDSLRVRWPGGGETVLRGIAADREIVVRQP